MANEVAKKFYTSGNVTQLVQYTADALTDTVTPAVYELRKSMAGYYLYKKCDYYPIPKLYGNMAKRAAKIISTYNTREVSTGVLLSGDRGTGKSLLSMLLSNISVDNGSPVIEITEASFGSDFEELLNAIPNAVLVFDEFGKVYRVKSKDSNDDPQEHLLSFFDGAGARKRLMIFTENKASDINEYMLNRPGRIYYHYRYSKLSPDVIAEYCEEAQIAPEDITFLQNYAITSREFSFDILKAIVEETLRYPAEDIRDLIEDLNITTSDSSKNIKVVSILDTVSNEEYVPFGEDSGVISYRSSMSIYILPKHPEKQAVERARLTKLYDEHIEEYPEDINRYSAETFATELTINIGSTVLTTKDGITYVSVNNSSGNYMIGYIEVGKVLPNYMGYLGAY